MYVRKKFAEIKIEPVLYHATDCSILPGQSFSQMQVMFSFSFRWNTEYFVTSTDEWSVSYQGDQLKLRFQRRVFIVSESIYFNLIHVILIQQTKHSTKGGERSWRNKAFSYFAAARSFNHQGSCGCLFIEVKYFFLLTFHDRQNISRCFFRSFHCFWLHLIFGLEQTRQKLQ